MDTGTKKAEIKTGDDGRTCNGCWHYMDGPWATSAKCEQTGDYVSRTKPPCEKWHDRRGPCQDETCEVCGNASSDGGGIKIWDGLGLDSLCDGCRAATDPLTCALGCLSLGRSGKVCGGAEVGPLRERCKHDPPQLDPDLDKLQDLLALLLEGSTELVSRGGVASYTMKLRVGEYVDLCRAAGVDP